MEKVVRVIDDVTLQKQKTKKKTCIVTLGRYDGVAVNVCEWQ